MSRMKTCQKAQNTKLGSELPIMTWKKDLDSDVGCLKTCFWTSGRGFQRTRPEWKDPFEAFDIISHNILTNKLRKYRLDKVMQSGYVTGWSFKFGSPEFCPGSSINNFINDLDNRTDCMLRKFVYDNKLGRVADTLEGKAKIQKDLDWLEKNGLQSMTWASTKTSAKYCTWDGIIQIQTGGVTG